MKQDFFISSKTFFQILKAFQIASMQQGNSSQKNA